MIKYTNRKARDTETVILRATPERSTLYIQSKKPLQSNTLSMRGVSLAGVPNVVGSVLRTHEWLGRKINKNPCKMKTLLLVLAIAFFFATPAEAARPIWNADNTKIVGYISDEDWNRSMAEAVARQDPTKTIIQAGTKITNGVLKDECPIWFLSFSCVLPSGWKITL